MFPIPIQLQHYAPIFKALHQIPIEDYDDEPNLDPIISFLKSIYCKLSFPIAEDKFESDLAELSKLYEEYGEEYFFLNFLEGFLSPHILHDLFEEEDEYVSTGEIPPLNLVVNLPPNFITIEDYGSIKANDKDVELSLYPTDKSVLKFKLENIKKQDYPKASRTITTINWGNVKGTKIIHSYPAPIGCEDITYLLEVPGGAAVIEVNFPTSKFQINELELCLQGMSVNKNPSA